MFSSTGNARSREEDRRWRTQSRLKGYIQRPPPPPSDLNLWAQQLVKPGQPGGPVTLGLALVGAVVACLVGLPQSGGLEQPRPLPGLRSPPLHPSRLASAPLPHSLTPALTTPATRVNLLARPRPAPTRPPPPSLDGWAREQVERQRTFALLSLGGAWVGRRRTFDPNR